MSFITIAMDGPAGAGKSSVAKEVAKQLDILYLDTGAMYRTVALYMLRNCIDVNDAEAVSAQLSKVDITVRHEGGVQVTMLGGEDVSSEIRREDCGSAASTVAKIPAVRERMVSLQRDIAKGVSLIMDGRDIGTKVLPDAAVKIFITASAEERARRRYTELVEKKQPADYYKVLADIIQRDYQDTHRAASPLVKADDAVELDTSDMNKEEAIEAVLQIVRAAK